MKAEIKMVPLNKIRVINPRYRDPKKFDSVLQSIKLLGLKKPIQISKRGATECDEDGFDLVCGQGRMEAFAALGHSEIPAIVVDIPREERLLRSLIENMARRFPSPSDLIKEIERLKKLGHSNVTIARKLGTNDTLVGGLLALSRSGEERLLEAALSGKVPITIAVEISKAEGAEAQRQLLKAYESKLLAGVSIRMLKKLLAQRQFLGKKRWIEPTKRPTSTEALVKAYRKETSRQQALVRKAKLCDARLLFLVTAFRKLLRDDLFVTILHAQDIGTMPQFLAERIAHNN